MSMTYTGILRDNSIEWTAPAPELPPEGVRVQVTLLEGGPAACDQGQQMAAALGRLAAARALATIADPVAWEREVRQDRELLGRD
jgi:hypothetical protein